MKTVTAMNLTTQTKDVRYKRGPTACSFHFCVVEKQNYCLVLEIDVLVTCGPQGGVACSGSWSVVVRSTPAISAFFMFYFHEKV